MAAIVVHVADARTSVLHPASTTHRQLSDEQLVAAGVKPEFVNVKATTEEGLGFTGALEGISAHAVCVIINPFV
jgi:O-acetylhomoserine (thiol)-lyase